MVNLIKIWMKQKHTLPMILILSLLFASIGAISPKASTLINPLDQWYWRNPLPTGNHLQDVAYGNNMYVIVGDHGTILTSKTKTDWKRQDVNTNKDLRSIAFGNGKFVAVGSGTVLTSTDSLNWKGGVVLDAQLPSLFLNEVVYGNGKFIAYGYIENALSRTQVLITSTNGEEWTLKVVEKEIVGISYGSNIFVAVGKTEKNEMTPIFTSIDGYTWTMHSSDFNGNVSSLTFGNDRFVAVGIDGPYYSVNGVIWTASNDWDGFVLKDVAYGNGVFMAIGLEGIVVSADGKHWTEKGVSFGGNGIGFGYNTFVTVSDEGKIQYSTNGDHWYKINSTKGAVFNNITYGKNTFVAVASSGEIFLSVDGKVWTAQVPNISRPLYDVAYGNSRFVVVGNEGTILSSSDGKEWSRSNYNGSHHLYGITYDNNKFVAVGSEGTILTSLDGLNWYSNQLTNSDDLYAITYGNNTFVAGSEAGKVYTSVNGMNWNAKQLGTNKPIIDITFGSRGFVAISYPNEIWTSVDATSWQLGTLTKELTRVAYGNNTYTAVGYQGSIVTSSDTINWINRESGTSNNLLGVVYGNNTFVVVGKGGTIIQSEVLSQEQLHVYLNKISGADGTTISVLLTPSRPANIYYTLNGSSPTQFSMLYQGPIVLSKEKDNVLKYMAIDAFGHRSEVYTEIFHFDQNNSDIKTNISFLPPLNNRDNVFKQGSTIPIKFILDEKIAYTKYSQGLKLYISELEHGAFRNEMEIKSEKIKGGNLFKFDEQEKVFHYNLSTKALKKGDYQLRIAVNDLTLDYVKITLR